MKISSYTASLVAIGLFASLANAAPASETVQPGISGHPNGEFQVAEEKAFQPPAVSPGQVEAIRFLKRARSEDASQLGPARLKNRIQNAQNLLSRNVSGKVEQQLRQLVRSDQQELQRRQTEQAQAAPAEKPAARKKQLAQAEQAQSEDQGQDEQPVVRKRKAAPAQESQGEEPAGDQNQAGQGVEPQDEQPVVRKRKAAQAEEAGNEEPVARQPETAQPEEPAAAAEGEAPIVRGQNADGAGAGEAPAVRQKPAAQAQASAEERQARQLLADTRDADKLPVPQLRQRLAKARALLASKQLSPRTEAGLRKMAAQDRNVVRARQTQASFDESNRGVMKGANAGEQPPKRADGGEEPATRDGDAKKDKKDKPRFNLDVTIVAGDPFLTDRRRSDELSEEELRRRIQVYRDVETIQEYPRYTVEERGYWRRQMVSDRELLRRRLLEERERRETELERDQDEDDIVLDRRPSREIFEEDVYVAEANDEEIEEILVAPPRIRAEKRYSVEDLANQPQLRKAIPRLEVDTIRFGFGESIVREEEIDKLDSIGNVIEKILRKYPREVFMIEGHTDAVGSDAFNLSLSRARAEAVKRALSTYFSIPSSNLRTVGLGERFLKIPTPDPEAENRRVSIGRVTNFVSSAE